MASCPTRCLTCSLAVTLTSPLAIVKSSPTWPIIANLPRMLLAKHETIGMLQMCVCVRAILQYVFRTVVACEFACDIRASHANSRATRGPQTHHRNTIGIAPPDTSRSDWVSGRSCFHQHGTQIAPEAMSLFSFNFHGAACILCRWPGFVISCTYTLRTCGTLARGTPGTRMHSTAIPKDS